jgi:glutathionylspermidine synthase
VAPFAGDWVAKPAWEREGAGVYFGAGEGLAEPEYVYQQRIRIAAHPLPIWHAAGPAEEQVTPVVGVYVIDGQAAGFLTRVGGPVTDRSAHVLPTLVWAE